jgi:hypothetical protein
VDPIDPPLRATVDVTGALEGDSGDRESLGQACREKARAAPDRPRNEDWPELAARVAAAAARVLKARGSAIGLDAQSPGRSDDEVRVAGRRHRDSLAAF